MEEASRGDMSQNLIPKYEFRWDDGTVRTTEDVPDSPDGIECLAQLGREDNNCEVALKGYST